MFLNNKRFPLLLFVFLLARLGSGAQKMTMMPGYCGIYYQSMPDLLRQKKAELDFYQFRPGQAVASIGAQCCHWEAAYAAAADSLLFYLQDIDTTYFNERQARFAWHYYDSLRDRPMTCAYRLILGYPESSGLPDGFFDKILIINSFHEFSQKEAMLHDLGRKLKPGGLLYIDESVPRRKGQLHGICRLPMLMPDEMKGILQAGGYEYVDALDINFRKGHPFRRIYAFRKAI